MASTYERLVAAGAPEIAEPNFYRIKENPSGDGVFVELRQRLAYGGSHVLGRHVIYPRSSSSALDDVVRACRALTDRYLDLEPAIESLLGDHSAAV